MVAPAFNGFLVDNGGRELGLATRDKIYRASESESGTKGEPIVQRREKAQSRRLVELCLRNMRDVVPCEEYVWQEEKRSLRILDWESKVPPRMVLVCSPPPRRHFPRGNVRPCAWNRRC